MSAKGEALENVDGQTLFSTLQGWHKAFSARTVGIALGATMFVTESRFVNRLFRPYQGSG